MTIHRPRHPRHAARQTGRLVTALAAAVVLSTAGGVAYAYWTTTGSGTGSGSTGTVVALTTSASTPSATQLVPGGSAPLVVTVTNPNASGVVITSIQLDGTRSVGVSGAVGTCTAPPVGVDATTNLPLAAGATATFEVAGATTLGSSAASGCQGATFTIPVVLTGRTS